MSLERVRAHYDRYPYPPRRALLLPRSDQGSSMAFEDSGLGHHRNRSILVAGCGTFEAVVVGQANPFAAGLTGIDLSSTSIRSAKRRYLMARLAGRRLPLAEFKTGSFMQDLEIGQTFDYITASNVLHHLPDPEAGLKALADRLKSKGVIRMVVYGRHSRETMRQLQDLFFESGLRSSDDHLLRRCLRLVRTLPGSDARRLLFESHAEINHPSGLRDAFFHPLENPPSFIDWKTITRRLGLEWLKESTAPSLYTKEGSCPWSQLDNLDRQGLVTRNPVIWLRSTK